MSTIKSRVEKLMRKNNKSNSYAEIIRKHAIEHKEGYGKDEGILVHVIMSLYITSYPEHKSAIKARNTISL